MNRQYRGSNDELLRSSSSLRNKLLRCNCHSTLVVVQVKLDFRRNIPEFGC